MVRCGESVMCLMSPGHPIDIGWARPAILVAGKGRGGMFYFICFFTFIPVPLSSMSLSFIFSTISSISFSHSLGDNTKWPTRVDVLLNPNTINKAGVHMQSCRNAVPCLIWVNYKNCQAESGASSSMPETHVLL